MILPFGDDPETAAIRANLVQWGLGLIHPRKAAVLHLYYFEGLTDAEVGQKLGVSDCRANQLRTKGLRALREKLCLEGRTDIGCASIYS